MSLRKIIGIAFRFIARVFLCLVVLPVLLCLWPVYKIRLGTLHTQRIGHLAGNTEVFLRELQRDGAPARTAYFLFGWDPANRQLLKMFLRESYPSVHLIESLWWTRFAFAWRGVLIRTPIWLKIPCLNNEARLFTSTKPVIRFTAEEEERGRRALQEIGIGASDWFVCFHARDGKYLRSWRPQFEDWWRKTDVNNCSIENYLPAMNYITELGGFAVRMGALVDRPLPETGNSKIIDYAVKHRSDFMDVYLSANCHFFLGCSSGLLQVPTTFGRPVIIANNIIFDHAPVLADDLMIPRLLKTPDGSRVVTFDEAKKAGYDLWTDQGPTYIDTNAEMFAWRENDPEDILDVCKDMIDLLEGREPTKEAKRMQAEFGERYLSHMPDYPIGGKIGARFAKKYKDFIVPAGTGDQTGD